jgi:gas vesicle protein
MYFNYKEKTQDNFREFTDMIMSKISELSEECEEYWNSRKITNRLKNWKDKTRQRIASWRE